MKQDTASEGTLAPRDEIRRLGYDPDHLTAGEQQELLAIESLLASQQDQRRILARL